MMESYSFTRLNRAEATSKFVVFVERHLLQPCFCVEPHHASSVTGSFAAPERRGNLRLFIIRDIRRKLAFFFGAGESEQRACGNHGPPGIVD